MIQTNIRRTRRLPRALGQTGHQTGKISIHVVQKVMTVHQEKIMNTELFQVCCKKG